MERRKPGALSNELAQLGRRRQELKDSRLAQLKSRQKRLFALLVRLAAHRRVQREEIMERSPNLSAKLRKAGYINTKATIPQWVLDWLRVNAKVELDIAGRRERSVMRDIRNARRTSRRVAANVHALREKVQEAGGLEQYVAQQIAAEESKP